MNRMILALWFVLPLAAPVRADDKAPPPEVAASITNRAGEVLSYRLYWGYIPVGTATASIDWTEYEGRRVLVISFRTRSNKFLDKIYPVDDTIESLADPQTLLPLRFTKNISEGKHRYYEETVFDRTNLVARWVSKKSGRAKMFPIQPDTRDIPTFMYAMREHRFAPGTREHYRVMADEKVYDLWIDVKEKEKIALSGFGDVPTIRTEPEAAFDGLFVRRGKISIWITDDPRCVAAQIVASVPVATVQAVLCAIEGGGDDRWTKPTAKSTPQAKPVKSDQ